MNNFCKTILSVCLVLLLGSCGVISKTRYGNGLKLNIETNLFSKGEDQTEKTKQKHVPRKRISIKPVVASPVKPVLDDKLPGEVSEVYTPVNDSAVQVDPVEKARQPLKQGFGKVKEVVIQKVKQVAPLMPNDKDYRGDPMEPNSLAAGILFYGAVLISILGTSLMLPEAFFTILPLAVIAGFILAFIALHKHKISGYAYSGYGLALSIVIIGGLYLLAGIIFLAALIAFL